MSTLHCCIYHVSCCSCMNLRIQKFHPPVKGEGEICVAQSISVLRGVMAEMYYYGGLAMLKFGNPSLHHQYVTTVCTSACEDAATYFRLQKCTHHGTHHGNGEIPTAVATFFAFSLEATSSDQRRAKKKKKLFPFPYKE